MPNNLLPFEYLLQWIGNPRQGDCLCFDYDAIAQLPLRERKHILKLFKWLQEINIKLVLITNHSPEFVVELPLYHVKPNQSKADLLQEFLNSEVNKHNTLRILVFLPENASDISPDIRQQSRKIQVYTYLMPTGEIVIGQAEIDLPTSLQEYTVNQRFESGTQSVFKLSASGRPSLVIKFGAHEQSLTLEILFLELARLLGIPVPTFRVFSNIPPGLAKLLADYGNYQDRLCKVSTFLPSDPVDKHAISQHIKTHFAALAYLGNIDAQSLENWIVHENTCYLIDGGLNILYRAFNGTGRENPYTVSEMESLRDCRYENADMFAGLSAEEIQKQVEKLVTREADIQKACCRLADVLKIELTLRSELLAVFAERLDDLRRRYRIPTHSPRTELKPGAHTAAGVLTYSINTSGEVLVLLSKRSDIPQFDNFGGQSSPLDESLAHTASREVFEESSGQISYTPGQLREASFIDFVNLDGRVYRLHIPSRPHPEVDLERLMDREHVSHVYIPLKQLLKEIAFNPLDPGLNHQTTITFKCGDSEITLFAPLYALLTSPPMRAMLNELLKKQPFSSPLPRIQREYIQGREEKPQHRYRVTLRDSVATSALIHLRVISVLKRNMTKTSVPVDYCIASGPGDLSLSEILMLQLLGAGAVPASLKSNVLQLLAHLNDQLPPATSDRIANQFRELILTERAVQETHLVFYHAFPGKVLSAYLVYTALCRIAYGVTHGYMIRLGNPPEYAQNVAAFLQHFGNNNNVAGYAMTTLSANLTLFGNFSTLFSCSVSYYIAGNSSRELDLKHILTSTLGDNAQLIDLILPMLEQLTHEISEKTGSGLLQIRMPATEVTDQVFLSKAGGVPHPYKGSLCPVRARQALRDDLNNADTEVRDHARQYLESVQARVLAQGSLFECQFLCFNAEDVVSSTGLVEEGIKRLVDLFQSTLDLQMIGQHFPPNVPVRRLYGYLAARYQEPCMNETMSRIAFQQAIHGNNVLKVLAYLEDHLDSLSDALALAMESEKTAMLLEAILEKYQAQLADIQLTPPANFEAGAVIQPVGLVEYIEKVFTQRRLISEKALVLAFKACHGNNDWFQKLHEFVKRPRRFESSHYYTQTIMWALKNIPSEEGRKQAFEKVDKSKLFFDKGGVEDFLKLFGVAKRLSIFIILLNYLEYFNFENSRTFVQETLELQDTTILNLFTELFNRLDVKASCYDNGGILSLIEALIEKYSHPKTKIVSIIQRHMRSFHRILREGRNLDVLINVTKLLFRDDNQRFDFIYGYYLDSLSSYPILVTSLLDSQGSFDRLLNVFETKGNKVKLANFFLKIRRPQPYRFMESNPYLKIRNYANTWLKENNKGIIAYMERSFFLGRP